MIALLLPFFIVCLSFKKKKIKIYAGAKQVLSLLLIFFSIGSSPDDPNVGHSNLGDGSGSWI